MEPRFYQYFLLNKINFWTFAQFGKKKMDNMNNKKVYEFTKPVYVFFSKKSSVGMLIFLRGILTENAERVKKNERIYENGPCV